MRSTLQALTCLLVVALPAAPAWDARRPSLPTKRPAAGALP